MQGVIDCWQIKQLGGGRGVEKIGGIQFKLRKKPGKESSGGKEQYTSTIESLVWGKSGGEPILLILNESSTSITIYYFASNKTKRLAAPLSKFAKKG